MHIRANEVDRIAIDKFTSQSGLWLSVLTERNAMHGGHLKEYNLLILDALTHRVRKIYHLCFDDPALAFLKWEAWRQAFGGKSEHNFETDIPSTLTELKFTSPPWIIPEDHHVLKLNPRGSRMFVRELSPVDEVTVRAEKAGLHIAIAEENKPQPTMGIILKLSLDPMWQAEGYEEGDIVMFGKFSGHTFMEAGQQYRALGPHEIIGSRKPADGLDDLVPPHPFDSAGCRHCAMQADAEIHGGL